MKEELETFLKQRPFTPFRLHFTNQNTHDVTHPDSMLVSDEVAAVALGHSIWVVAMAHIVEIEPLASVKA